MTAMRVGARNAERVDRLALLCTGAQWPPRLSLDRPRRDGARRRQRRRRQGGRRALVHFRVPRGPSRRQGGPRGDGGGHLRIRRTRTIDRRRSSAWPAHLPVCSSNPGWIPPPLTAHWPVVSRLRPRSSGPHQTPEGTAVLSGRTAVVTGGAQGIGLAATTGRKSPGRRTHRRVATYCARSVCPSDIGSFFSSK